MESIHRLAPSLSLPLIIFIALAACTPIQAQHLPATATATAVPSPTATIQWFPPTATLTPQPVSVPSATPVYLPGLGNEIFTDDFSSPIYWNTASSDEGSVSVSRDRITVAVKAADTVLFSLRSEPLLGDFYVRSTRTQPCAAAKIRMVFFFGQTDLMLIGMPWPAMARCVSK